MQKRYVLVRVREGCVKATGLSGGEETWCQGTEVWLEKEIADEVKLMGDPSGSTFKIVWEEGEIEW